MANPLIAVEEPVVREILDKVPPGTALDAACGTGRWAEELVSRGHAVIGVDETPEMLAHARRKLPDADLRSGRLESLPVDSESIDFAICALALSHCPQLTAAIAELARVLRPGGRLVVTELHPVNVVLGGGALFPRKEGGYGLVRGYPHRHADYVEAFVSAGFEITRCEEPSWKEEHLASMAGPLFAVAPDAFREACVGLPGALIWEATRRL